MNATHSAWKKGLPFHSRFKIWNELFVTFRLVLNLPITNQIEILTQSTAPFYAILSYSLARNEFFGLGKTPTRLVSWIRAATVPS
jgi:hypothetical protein